MAYIDAAIKLPRSISADGDRRGMSSLLSRGVGNWISERAPAATALAAAERSLEFRFGYWRATLAMIRDYPCLACGPGQFQDYYATYKLPEASEVVQDPHNWLLGSLGDSGYAGSDSVGRRFGQ